MVTYEIQGPDGKTYSIDGPEGASREDVIAAIQARMQAQPVPAPAAETKPATTEAAPIEEATKGAKSGVSALKSMWEGAGIAKDVGVASQALKSLDLYSQIDKGALNRSNLTPAVAGGDMSPQFRDAQIYLAADEKKRQQLRERATSEIQNRKDFIAAAVKTIQQYQEENKKNKGRTENLTDVEGAKDFANWLSFNVGSGAVQMAPVMLAAISTGGIGAYLMGTGMELGGATQNRLEFILNKTKDETDPEKRAKAIFDYVQKTNDTSLAQAIASGAVDVLLGPVADVIKTPLKQAVREKTRKEIAKQIPKAVARQTGEEAVAGGTQETIAIAAERALEEQTGDVLSKDNIKRVVNAAAAEAVGGGGVSAVTGAARVALGPKAEETAPSVEPTAEPAAPVTPATPADPRKEALVKSYVDQGFMPDDAELLATQALGGLESAAPAAPAAPIAQPTALEVAKEAPAFLPRELAGAKPRYAYGNKLFQLQFESDIDRAAYIAAQETPSKRDADYVSFVARATGMSEPEIRAHGRTVRNAIKTQAKASESGGTLEVATVSRAKKPVAPLAVTQQPEVQNVPTTEPPPFVTEPSTDERGVPVPNESVGAPERPATAIDRGLGAAGSAARQLAGREEVERAALEKRQELAERTLSRGFATQPYPDLGVVLGAGWVRNELAKSPTPEQYQEAAYARLEELGGIPPTDAAPAFERRAPAVPTVGERPEARAERPAEAAPAEAMEAPATTKAAEPVKTTTLPEAKPGEDAMPIQRGSVAAVPMELLTTPEALKRAGEVLSVPDKTPERIRRELDIAARRGGLSEKEAREIIGEKPRGTKTPKAVETMEAPAATKAAESIKEKLFNVQRTQPEAKRGDAIRFNLPWVPGGYEVSGIVGDSVYLDRDGREVSQNSPGAKRYVNVTYKVEGDQITNPIEIEALRLNTIRFEEKPDLTKPQEEPSGTKTPKAVEAKAERPAQPAKGAAPLELEATRRPELEVEPEVDIALKNIDEHMKAVYGTTAAGTPRKRGAGAGRPETGAAKTLEQRTEQAKDINQLNRDIATAIKAADKLSERQAPEAFSTPEEYEYREEARAQKLDQVRMALYGAAQRARTRPITGYVKAAEYLRKLKPAEQQRAKDLFEGKIKPNELPPKPTTKTTEGQRKKVRELVNPDAQKIADDTFDAKDAKKMTFDDLAALTQAAMELAAEQHTQDTDKTFAQLDTLAGALAYIAQTGAPLDAGMAEALLTGENGELVKNVSLYAVKPLREGQEATVLQKALDGAYGSYVPRTDRTGGVVLLEDSGKVRSGLNNLTVLHEGVHAVTSLKLFYIEAMEAAGRLDEVDDRLLDAYNELNELMVQANGAAADMMRNGTLPKEVTELARKDAFTDVHEFVAYGLTDANMKAFLLTVPGIGTKKSGLSRFISALLKLLQIGKDNASALRDLVIVSGKFMEAKTPEAKAMAEAYQRSVNTIADEIKQQKKTATKAQEQTKTVKKAEEKLKAAATATEVVEQMGSLMQVAKNPSLWVDYLKVNYRNLATPVYKGYLSVLPTNVLVDLAEAFTIGNVKQLNSAVQKMHTFRTKTLHKVQELAVPWIKLNAKEQKKLADVMHMATDLQVDPAKNKTNALLNSRWNALTPEAKAVYTKVRDFYKGNYDLYRALLAKRVSDTPINNADRQNLMNAIKQTYETGAKIEPYFPFMRYGEYWVSFGKGVNKEFYMFESPGERDLFRDRRAAELKRRDPNIEIEAGNDVAAMRKNLQGDSANLKALFGLVDSMQVSDPDIKNTLKNEIFQLHLLTLPEASFRKQFIKRKGTAGFSGDALRNFITSGTRFANQIARIKYGPEIRNSLAAAEASLEGDPDRPQKSMVTNELGLRMKDELEPEFKDTALDTISRGVNKAAFVWLLTSVHSAANQLFSLANFTLPTLAKYHGWGAATAQLTATMANMYTQVGTTTLDKEGNVTYTPPTMMNNRSLRLTPLEQRAYQAMLDRGIADATRTYDLFLRKGQPTATYNDKKEKVVNALGALFHSAESMSREVTFMTAFRLNIRKMPFEDAVENAIHTVNESLFDYSPWNAPRALKSAPARIVTQFMKFPLFVSIYLLRNARAMMKPMDGESRTAAAKALFGTLGITGILAGVSGLPMFSTFMGLAQGLRNLMADDDEEIVLEEDDLMRWFRNVWLPETFGDTTVMGMNLAELIDSGVLNAATGFDFASGISLNNMWFRDAPESSNWKDAYATSINSMLGPGVGLGESWASAIDDINKGDTLKGFEKLTPALFRGSLTAARYKMEGAVDAALRPIKEADEFTYGQLLMQAMGFKTTGLAKVMEDNFAIRQMQQKILQQRTSLISNLDRATTMDREADFEKTLEKIDEYNMKYPSPDLRIDYEDIQNAMERRRKAMRMTERGMIQDPRFRDLEVLRERGLELIEKEAAE